MRPRRISAGGFQSTHPLRGATTSVSPTDQHRDISIHAPLAGCDRSPRTSTCRCAQFQSTHPLRGATRLAREISAREKEFQSTHPLRGATIRYHIDRQNLAFQSTHPLRGATCSYPISPYSICISIHAPLAGCDAKSLFFANIVDVISIHAPLAGCDSPFCGCGCGNNIYFNPRTPCGVRQVIAISCLRFPANFNPRTPCGVRL